MKKVIAVVGSMGLLCAASPAYAQAAWGQLNGEDETIEKAGRTSAYPEYSYEVTLDESPSEAIRTYRCVTFKTLGKTVSGTYTVKQCMSRLCPNPVDIIAGGTYAAGAGVAEDFVTPFVRVEGSVGDVIQLSCGG